MVPCAPLEDVEEPEPCRKMELYVSGGEVSAGRGGGSPRAPACLCPAAWEPPGRGREEEVEEGVEEEEEEEGGRSAARRDTSEASTPSRPRVPGTAPPLPPLAPAADATSSRPEPCPALLLGWESDDKAPLPRG